MIVLYCLEMIVEYGTVRFLLLFDDDDVRCDCSARHSFFIDYFLNSCIILFNTVSRREDLFVARVREESFVYAIAQQKRIWCILFYCIYLEHSQNSNTQIHKFRAPNLILDLCFSFPKLKYFI